MQTAAKKMNLADGSVPENDASATRTDGRSAGYYRLTKRATQALRPLTFLPLSDIFMERDMNIVAPRTIRGRAFALRSRIIRPEK